MGQGLRQLLVGLRNRSIVVQRFVARQAELPRPKPHQSLGLLDPPYIWWAPCASTSGPFPRPVSPCQGYSRRLTTLTPGLGCASVADCPQNGEYVLGLVLFRWSRRLGEPKAQAFTQRKGNALGKRVMSRYFSVGPTGQPFAGGTCWPVGPMHLHNCAPLPRALPSLLHTRRAGRRSIGAFTPLSAIPTRSNLPSTKEAQIDRGVHAPFRRRRCSARRLRRVCDPRSPRICGFLPVTPVYRRPARRAGGRPVNGPDNGASSNT